LEFIKVLLMESRLSSCIMGRSSHQLILMFLPLIWLDNLQFLAKGVLSSAAVHRLYHQFVSQMIGSPVLFQDTQRLVILERPSKELHSSILLIILRHHMRAEYSQHQTKELLRAFINFQETG